MNDDHSLRVGQVSALAERVTSLLGESDVPNTALSLLLLAGHFAEYAGLPAEEALSLVRVGHHASGEGHTIQQAAARLTAPTLAMLPTAYVASETSGILGQRLLALLLAALRGMPVSRAVIVDALGFALAEILNQLKAPPEALIVPLRAACAPAPETLVSQPTGPVN